MENNVTQILIADAQYLIRAGLKQLVDGREDLEVIAEVSDTQGLWEQLNTHQPHVVLMDYGWMGVFSPDDVKRIKQLWPQIEVVVISGDLEKKKINQALGYGAKGFLTKTCDADEILGAITAAAQGEQFLCNKILDIVLERKNGQRQGNPCDPMNISAREIEIIRYMAAGLKADEIADALSLSKHTVYTHRKNIKRKLALNNAAEIVHFAVKANWVD